MCVWWFWIPHTLSIYMEWHLSLSHSEFLNFFLFCSKTLVYQKNNRWNDSELKDYLVDMGKRKFIEMLIRDQKNNPKMYISKIGIIEMIYEIEKPNEDSFQIQFYSKPKWPTRFDFPLFVVYIKLWISVEKPFFCWYSPLLWVLGGDKDI